MLLILIVTVLASMYGFSNPSFVDKMSLKPYAISRYREYYRFITHGFVHADYMHLFFNAFTFYFAAQTAEMIFGVLFIPIYLLAIVVSSLPDYFQNKNNAYYGAIGASGGVSAVLFSLLLFSPWGIVRVYFIPVYFIIFGILYLMYSYYMSNQNTNVGHRAHLWGAIFGLVITLLLIPDSGRIFLEQLIYKNPFAR